MKILVVGDIMLDEYCIGMVERMSPESGVPIFKFGGVSSTCLGGAGNLAVNLSKLGAYVALFGICGKTRHSELLSLMEYDNIYSMVKPCWTTTVKQRFVTDQLEHVMRLDLEAVPHKDLTSEHLLKGVEQRFDLIVVSDYAKGVVNEEVMKILKSRNVPIIVDPKPVNVHLYKGVDMICPNLKEWEEMRPNFDEIGCEVVVTKARDGIEVIYNGNHSYFPSNPIDVVDVCGAGDTVTAVMAVCKAMGKNVTQSAATALKCAEYVVTQPGTVPITKEVFEENLV